MQNKRLLLEFLGLRTPVPVVAQPTDDSSERLHQAQLRLRHAKEQAALQLAVTEYIENIPKNWLLVQEEHTRDVEAYRISALRYGDFLSVMMERWIGEKLTRHALMVNLGKTNEIVTKIGSPPTIDGEALFSVITMYGESHIIENSAFEYQRVRGFVVPVETYGVVGAGYIPARIANDSDIIRGTPVPARDDTIIFFRGGYQTCYSAWSP